MERKNTREININVLLAELIEAKAIEYKSRETTPEELEALAEVVTCFARINGC